MQPVSRNGIEFAELLAMPGVDEHLELRSRFGFMAFHGGNLERRTDIIAREAAQRSGASYYGVIQPKGTREHIPSKLVSPDASERLQSFIDHCDVAVAIHGYGLRGRWIDLLLGGGNRDLAAHMAHHIGRNLPQYRAVHDLDQIPTQLRGVHPANPVNLLRGGGVQIELPPRVRGLTPMALHWPSHDHRTQRFPHMEDLIEGLAAGARIWSSRHDLHPAPTHLG